MDKLLTVVGIITFPIWIIPLMIFGLVYSWWLVIVDILEQPAP